MKDSLVRLLICPETGSELALEVRERAEGEVKEGRLVAANGRAYPIVEFVPRFVESDDYAASFSAEWNRWSRIQLDSVNGSDTSRKRFVDTTGLEPERLEGQRVLEIGCGMGRFLEVVAGGEAEVVGIDLSLAVDAAFANVGLRPNVHIVQADLRRLPFRPGTFDLVYSIGVLHHTPSTRDAVSAVAPQVKPEGTLAVWLYGASRIPDWVPRPLWLYKFVGRRLRGETLMKILDWYVPFALAARRVPLLGRIAPWVFPVAKTPDEMPLTPQQHREWTTLDTFDWFTPTYSWAHTFDEVEDWFRGLGFSEVERRELEVAVAARR